MFWLWKKIDVPPSKVWGPGNFNIFRATTEEIRVFNHIIKEFNSKHNNQQRQFATNNNAKKIKSKIKLTIMQHHNEELQKFRSTLSNEQKCLNELNREQGASSWLTTIIPSEKKYYDLTKQSFWHLIVSDMVGQSQD